jgi:GAF domain-containing protein
LWLLDAATGDLVLEAAFGLGKEAARKVGRIAAGKASINQRVAETGQPYICKNAKREEGFYQIYELAQSSVTVPLKYRETVIGTLNVESSRLNAFTLDHQQLLEGFTSQASIAIKNAQFFEELGDKAKQLEQLQNVTRTFTSQPSEPNEVLGLGTIFPDASCSIRLYDSGTDEFKPQVATGVLKDLLDIMPREEGTSRYIMKTRLPRYLQDAPAMPTDGGPRIRQDILDRGVKATAYLPLLSKSQVIGILYVDLLFPHQFSNDEERILELFAGQAAIAIENARLFKEREVLSEIGKELAASAIPLKWS